MALASVNVYVSTLVKVAASETVSALALGSPSVSPSVLCSTLLSVSRIVQQSLALQSAQSVVHSLCVHLQACHRASRRLLWSPHPPLCCQVSLPLPLLLCQPVSPPPPPIPLVSPHPPLLLCRAVSWPFIRLVCRQVSRPLPLLLCKLSCRVVSCPAQLLECRTSSRPLRYINELPASASAFPWHSASLIDSSLHLIASQLVR